MAEIRKVDAQQQAEARAKHAEQRKEQAQETKAPVFEKPSAWDYIKAVWQGFTEYYPDKYEGTESIGDALSRTKEIIDEGAVGLDEGTFDKVKDPIKEWSRGVEAKLDDGDDSHLSMGERLWRAAQGTGKIADKLASIKGVIATGVTVGVAALVARGAVAQKKRFWQIILMYLRLQTRNLQSQTNETQKNRT